MITISITVNNFYKTQEKSQEVKKQIVNDICIGIIKRNLSLDTSDFTVVSYLQDLPCHNDAALKRGDVL